MIDSLAQKTVKGIGWMVSWRILTRIIGIISISVLARIFTPADFGLIALAYAFARAMDAISILGVDLILIREPLLDEELYSTGFTISFLKSVITAIIVMCLARKFATFFRDSRLEVILYCFSLGLVLEGLENVGVLEFRKALRFRQDFVLFAVPRLISAVVTIIVAVTAKSYWAMVVGIMSYKILRTSMTYVLHPFRPRLTLVARKRLLRFSIWIWANSLAMFVRDRADSFVVGRMMSTTSLGIFSAAFEIAILPITEIVEPIGRVLFPGISAAHHGGMETGTAVSRSIGGVTFLLLPAAVGVSLIAGPLISVTLGHTWINGIAIVQITAPWAVWSIFSAVGSSALVVLGKPRIVTVATAGLAIIRPFLLVLGLTIWGMQGVACAVALCYPIEAAYYLVALTRLTRFRPWSLWRELWRSLISAVVMIAVVVGLGLGWAPPPNTTSTALSQLILGAFVGAASYTSCVFTLWALWGCPDGPEALVFKLVVPRVVAAPRMLRAIGAAAKQALIDKICAASAD